MGNRTRRQFLEDSMFATAAAVAAGSASPLFAQEKQSSSPSEKLSVCVMGVRGRGGSHIGAFAGRKDTEITYVCDADREVGEKRVQEIAKRQERTPTFVEDIRTVLDDKTVDIVSIATPNHWHSLAGIWAMQAGKDVYVEKPVSHNVSEGRRLVEAARKYERICQAGTQSRANPGMQAAMEYVHGGKIGDIKLARGLCYKPRGPIGPAGKYEVPSSVNYSLWLGPAKFAPLTRQQFHYDWHWQWAYGNGDLGNQGIHQMDLARWALGEDAVCERVISYGGRFGYEDAGETANTQVVVCDYGDRSLVFEVRGLKTSDYKGAKIGVIVEGTEGYVVMTSYHSGAAFDRDGNQLTKFSGEGDHFANFLEGVRTRDHKVLYGDVEQGHLSSALCHLGNISYLLGSDVSADEAEKKVAMLKTTDNALETLERTLAHLKDNGVDMGAAKLTVGPQLTLDQESETFVENAEADKLLTRDYRKGFEVPEKV